MHVSHHRLVFFAASVTLTSSFLLSGCGSGGANRASGVAPKSVTNGPLLAYVWSAADQSLLPVLGVPGASQLGQSVIASNSFSAAAASTASSIALLQGADGALALASLPGGQTRALNLALKPGAQLAISPSGTAAIGFDSSGAIALVTDITTTPSVTLLHAGSAVLQAVVSDSGVIAAQTSSQVISRLTGAAPGAQLATVTSFGGMAFTSGGDLLLADASVNTLSLVHASDAQPSATLINTAGLLKSPRALAVSAGRWVVVANSAENSVVRLDLSLQAAPQRIVCVCTPTLVQPATGPGNFLLTSFTAGPVWGVHADGTAPRTFFIPALSQ